MAEIDLSAFSENLCQVQKRVCPAGILAMVKANAYGHGSIAIARLLEKHRVALLGVAYLEEAIPLREGGITLPIVVMTGVRADQISEAIRYNLTPVVFNRESLSYLSHYAQRYHKVIKVHLKIDTGMGRLGVSVREAQSFIEEAYHQEGLYIEGVMSHFSDADLRDLSFAQGQVEAMEGIWGAMHQANIQVPYCHIANSAAIIRLASAHFNLVRPGLMLYGYSPVVGGSEVSLKPVMQIKTRVLSIKRVPAGVSISYGRTFVTQKESMIAALSIGYADGYPRLLSNQGVVIAKGVRVPVIGRVCMDMTMVDVTQVPSLAIGDWVTVLGAEGEADVWAGEIADWAHTIPYEILCGIRDRIPRVYIHE